LARAIKAKGVKETSVKQDLGILYYVYLFIYLFFFCLFVG